MAKRNKKTTSLRRQVRCRKKIRIRKKLLLQKGRVARLVVYRSNRYLYAQVVDDLKGHTLAQANTREKDFAGLDSKKNVAAAKLLGKLLAQRALEGSVKRVVFDRNGYDFHGRIKAVSDGAREAGLGF